MVPGTSVFPLSETGVLGAPEVGGGCHYSSAASSKMKYSFRIRLSKLEMEENFLDLMKGVYEEGTANTTLT